jgi:hypothetical protein
MHRVSGQGLHGKGSDKFAGRRSHNDTHLSALILKTSNNFGAFVGGNASRDAKNYSFV